MVRRSVRLPVALAAGLTVAFGPVAGVAPADPVSVTDPVTFDRALNLQGVQNGRDAGGYRTADGHWVRTGLVYRAGQLNNATPADLSVLTDRQVRVVDDLRTVYERTIAADRLPAGAVANWNDVIGQAPPQTLVTTLTGGNDLYRAFITAPGANEAFASVLRDIIDTDGAVLFHCTAGKDRTGLAAALLLSVLGVDETTVLDDYTLSRLFFSEHRMARLLPRLAGLGLDEERYHTVFGAPRHAMASTLDTLRGRYGTVKDYLVGRANVTPATIEALRARLVAPAPPAALRHTESGQAGCAQPMR